MSTESPIASQAVEVSDDWTPVRFDGFQFLARILQRWRFILSVTLVFALLGLAYALTRKPFFEAKASFLPPTHDVASTPQVNAYSLFAPSMQAATYIGFLKSSTVQRDVAEQLNLTQIFHVKDVDTAAEIVGARSTIDATQDGIVSVKVRADTATLSAAIANAYLSSVHNLTRRMAEDSLKQRSGFYADQLSQSRRSLEESEAALQSNQERGGILDANGTTQTAIAAQARLQAAVQAAQVRLSTLLQSDTDASPAVVRIRSEIAELRAQLTKQSSKAGSSARGVEAGGALPGLAIEAVRRTREVKEREAVYESLLKQTEINHMGQEDPGPQVQVIDFATVPNRKAGPGRLRYLVGGTLFGLCISTMWAAMAKWLVGIFDKLKASLKSAEVSGA